MNEQELTRRAEEIRRTEPDRYKRLWPNGHTEPEQAPESAEAAEDEAEEVAPKPKPRRRRKASGR